MDATVRRGGETMEDIDLTMLARSAYRAILRSIETPEAEEPENTDKQEAAHGD